MKKNIILSVSVAVLLIGCTEKTEVALKVARDKTENRLIKNVGETEVVLELYRNQYAALKERLVKLKTMQRIYIENVDQAYASIDGSKKINMYENILKDLNEKIPKAEAALKEFFEIYQTQKDQLTFLKEETATYQSAGTLFNDMNVLGDCEIRAERIKDLTQQLKIKAARAKTILEVNKTEETFLR